jgi:glycosyltransferase involved in cell wall biosynthesis
MKPRAIHQFHAGSAYGDGITNGMLFTQRVLRQAGYESDIFCVNVDPPLAGKLRSFREFVDGPEQLLFVHYSIGHDQHHWIDAVCAPKLLIYHNITPAHLFPAGSGLRLHVERGRDQLRRWAKTQPFIGAIADSSFNAEELVALGFAPIATIPLLVDLEHIQKHPWNRKLGSELADARNLLFLGQWSEHKGQLDLVRMMEPLRRLCKEPIRLILGGGVASRSYFDKVKFEIANRHLESNVCVFEKLPDEDVFAFYRAVDLYVSLSHHEGFGMPLVEAMSFDVPVVAFATGAIPSTLGRGGLLVQTRDPDYLGAAASIVLQEPWLRQQIVDAQRKELARFERASLVKALQDFLNGLDLEVDELAPAGSSYPGNTCRWQVEGPFDSSYSLAIVNRELASALAALGQSVSLVSRDGPGPFPPNKDFLRKHASVEAMWLAGLEDNWPTVALRNAYPPEVSDLKGQLRGLSCYAWEESGFPVEYVRAFNTRLNLITVVSRFVAKVLRDNGVRVPIRVVGDGIDQIIRHECEYVPDEKTALPRAHALRNSFCFLHVSSCLPRKGVDVLLAAWVKAFTRDDDVVLVIKTAPNQHHAIENDIALLDESHPNHARIVLINRDLGDQQIYELFRAAHVVVCPSRGEGFGLPLAEALMLGKSIITTRYGGQMDFCDDDNAWLCDYEFAYARTHLSVPGSVWVEPELDSLVGCLRSVRAATPEERARRSEAGRARVMSHFQWKHVASRLIKAVGDVETLDTRAIRLPKVAWVSTWNSRCGIAAYSKDLACEIPSEQLVVFANRNAAPLARDPAFVLRCWEQGWSDPLDELYQAIAAAEIDAVVIQFNFGFFELQALARLIDRLSDQRIPVYMVLHSTADVNKPDLSVSLSNARSVLARARRLLVHSVDDLNRLKRFGLVDNVTLLPFGFPQPPLRNGKGRTSSKRIIATFGYLLPHKGLRELIEAFAALRRDFPDIHLLMLNSLYPVQESEAVHQACKEAIMVRGLERHVTLKTDYLPDDEVLSELAQVDLIVYPYQNTHESASAAVRMGLSSLSPVACTPLPIFADVAAITHVLPGCSPTELASGMARLLSDDEQLFRLAEAQRGWVERLSWPLISQRLYGLIRGEYVEDLLPDEQSF